MRLSVATVGFVGNEIPTVDPLDSAGERCEMPTMMDLSTMRALSQLAGTMQRHFVCRGKEEEEEVKGWKK